VDKLLSEQNLRLNKRKNDWHKIFIFSSLFFLLSLTFGQIFSFDLFYIGWLALIYFNVILILVIYFPVFRRQLIYFGLISILSLLGGFVRVSQTSSFEQELDRYLNQKIEFQAIIVAEPDERESSTKLVIRPAGDYRAKILVTVERYPQYQLGDKVSVSGKIQRPENFITDNQKTFNYQRYLARDGIYYQMFKPNLSLLSHNSYGLRGLLLDVKNYLLKVLGKILPEPESSLLAGILLGVKRGLGSELSEGFRLAGVSHIMVLSGYNITIVAETILRLCSFLPRFLGGAVGLFGIFAFGLLAGGGTVVWRAVLMATIALYAKLTGQLYNVTTAIIFSALAISIYNPSTLTNDLGFQLSLLALIGLVYVSPFLSEGVFRRLSPQFGFKELICSTVGAQLSVIPFLWWTTGNLSLVGFISNLIILPLIPSAMFLGTMALLIGSLFTWLAWPISLITFFVLKIILLLTLWFARWPLADMSINISSGWIVILIYLCLSVPIVRFWYKKISSPANFLS